MSYCARLFRSDSINNCYSENLLAKIEWSNKLSKIIVNQAAWNVRDEQATHTKNISMSNMAIYKSIAQWDVKKCDVRAISRILY